jgi:Tn3 transposase DDE domain
VDRQHVNIQHILASLALKATRQSVIIAKLSSYPRKNRTKKALWELDNLRALKRGESYHKLVRAGRVCQRRQIASQNRSRATALERMLAAAGQLHHLLLSELLERAERRQDYQRADAIKRAYGFLDIGNGVDLRELVYLSEAAHGRAPQRRTEVAIY